MKIEKIIKTALFNIALDGRDYSRLDIVKALLSVLTVNKEKMDIIKNVLEKNGITNESQLLELIDRKKINFENSYSSFLADIINYYCDLLINKIDNRIDRMGNKAILSKREFKALIFNI